MPLHTYVNGMRYHNTPIGAVPGVTTVLGKTRGSYFDKIIEAWRLKVGDDVADSIMKNSAERGNLIHEAIEAILTVGTVNKEGWTSEIQTMWGMIKPEIVGLKDSKILLVEQPTHHPLGFGGTPDLVAEYEGKLTVFDWKTSRKVKKRSGIGDYLKQVAAYAKSVEFTYGHKLEQGVILVAVHKDEYLEISNPGLVVEPQILKFKITTKQLETHWNGFVKRLDQFNNLSHEPEWFPW